MRRHSGDPGPVIRFHRHSGDPGPAVQCDGIPEIPVRLSNATGIPEIPVRLSDSIGVHRSVTNLSIHSPMCLAIPARITSILPDNRAIADVGGVQRVVSTMLLEEACREGDWVLLHVGYALERIDPDRAQQTLDDLRAMHMLDVPA